MTWNTFHITVPLYGESLDQTWILLTNGTMISIFFCLRYCWSEIRCWANSRVAGYCGCQDLMFRHRNYNKRTLTQPLHQDDDDLKRYLSDLWSETYHIFIVLNISLDAVHLFFQITERMQVNEFTMHERHQFCESALNWDYWLFRLLNHYTNFKALFLSNQLSNAMTACEHAYVVYFQM